MMWAIPVTLVFGAIVLLTIYLYHTLRRPSGFPPGPPAVPILGSLPFMNLLSREGSPNFYDSLSKLAHTYGPVYSWAFGHSWVVVINDYALMKEAMVQRGTDFAGRNAWDMLRYENPYHPQHGIIDDDYSSQWKLQRHTTLQVLRKLGYARGVTERIIKEEAEIMNDTLRNTSGGPINIQDRIQSAVANVITSLLFGERYDYDDPELRELRKSVADKFAAMELVFQHEPIPGAFLLPPYRRNIRLLEDAGGRLISLIHKKIAEVPVDTDIHEPSNFIEGYRMEIKNNPEIENRLYQILSDFLQAGLETTSTALGWAVYFMIDHQKVQSKVQDELDMVIGRNRTTTLADREKLPYVEATLLEVLRLGKTAANAIPHVTLRDTSVGGFLIPARTEVWGLLWHLYTDPKTWSEPEVFKPERFLGPDGDVVNPEHHIPFGIGRRACMGEQLAKQELFLIFTHLLHTFHIRIAEGEKIPDPEGEIHLTHQPPKFNVNVTFRD